MYSSIDPWIVKPARLLSIQCVNTGIHYFCFYKLGFGIWHCHFTWTDLAPADKLTQQTKIANSNKFATAVLDHGRYKPNMKPY